jgi:hypothetical protein
VPEIKESGRRNALINLLGILLGGVFGLLLAEYKKQNPPYTQPFPKKPSLFLSTIFLFLDLPSIPTLYNFLNQQQFILYQLIILLVFRSSIILQNSSIIEAYLWPMN